MVISPKKFAHVVYQTGRFPEMVAWYEEVLGCTAVYQKDTLSFLTYDDEHHRIAIVAIPKLQGEAVDHGRPGVNHVAYTYATLDDLLATYVRLREAGVHPYWCVNHGITVSMYFRDPDGNQMEFQVDAFATPDEATRWMEGPKFAENPIGVEYDPEELLARRRAGASEEELLARPDEPMSAIPT
jgi:catechol-2,3-dioxygenase